jgi:hypothetical protein
LSYPSYFLSPDSSPNQPQDLDKSEKPRYNNINSIPRSHAMAVSISIENMTVSEKLAAMEALWESLSSDPSNIPSPSWHGDVLAAREDEASQNKDCFVDWEDCKKTFLGTTKNNPG